MLLTFPVVAETFSGSSGFVLEIPEGWTPLPEDRISSIEGRDDAPLGSALGRIELCLSPSPDATQSESLILIQEHEDFGALTPAELVGLAYHLRGEEFDQMLNRDVPSGERWSITEVSCDPQDGAITWGQARTHRDGSCNETILSLRLGRSTAIILSLTHAHGDYQAREAFDELLLSFRFDAATALEQPSLIDEAAPASSEAYHSDQGFSFDPPNGWQTIPRAALATLAEEAGVFDGWESTPVVEVGFCTPTEDTVTLPYFLVFTQAQEGQPTVESLINIATKSTGKDLAGTIREANPDNGSYPEEFYARSAFCTPEKGVVGMTTEIPITDDASFITTVTLHYGQDILVVIVSADLGQPGDTPSATSIQVHESLEFSPERAYTGASVTPRSLPSDWRSLMKLALPLAAVAVSLLRHRWTRRFGKKEETNPSRGDDDPDAGDPSNSDTPTL